MLCFVFDGCLVVVIVVEVFLFVGIVCNYLFLVIGKIGVVNCI